MTKEWRFPLKLVLAWQNLSSFKKSGYSDVEIALNWLTQGWVACGSHNCKGTYKNDVL
jgi:hypothetical protein